MSPPPQTIDRNLVRKLVRSQFPHWADLPICPVWSQGWDNSTFRLGDDLLVRLPSAERYSAQVEKEQAWLPRLAPSLPVQIPAPVAMGLPDHGYPWRWSIYRWIEGQTATSGELGSPEEFALELVAFLQALHRLDATNGPAPGPHNFFRGGLLSVYDDETVGAIRRLGSGPRAQRASNLWRRAMSTRWETQPVCVHGDFAAGNLLLRDGRLAAVIDFGCLAVGDPACDLVIAWTLLPPQARSVFKSAVGLDDDTWTRAQGWALWKALIVVTGSARVAPVDVAGAEQVLDELLLG